MLMYSFLQHADNRHPIKVFWRNGDKEDITKRNYTLYCDMYDVPLWMYSKRIDIFTCGSEEGVEGKHSKVWNVWLK